MQNLCFTWVVPLLSFIGGFTLYTRPMDVAKGAERGLRCAPSYRVLRFWLPLGPSTSNIFLKYKATRPIHRATCKYMVSAR